jgi:hypothetical protein
MSNHSISDPLGLDLGVSTEPVFNPKSIVREYMPQIFINVPTELKLHAKSLLDDGWRIYSVDQNRGRCYSQAKLITIPVWVIRDYISDPTKKVWYIAHEISHAIDRCKHSHGPEFMEILIRVCPPNAIHHELGYKPRNARSAGIGVPRFNSQTLEL